MSDPLDKLERGFALLALTAGVLGFGAVGLCGGIFTASLVPELVQGQSAGVALLIFSVPCVIAGVVMVKVCTEKILQLLRKPSVDEEAS